MTHNMSILCRHREIDGAALIRMVALAAERQAKRTLQVQEPVRDEKPEPRWMKMVGWTLIGLFLAYIAAHIVVALVR